MATIWMRVSIVISMIKKLFIDVTERLELSSSVSSLGESNLLHHQKLSHFRDGHSKRQKMY